MQLIKEASDEKLRGGFYTPEPIAAFLLPRDQENRVVRHEQVQAARRPAAADCDLCDLGGQAVGRQGRNGLL